MPKEKKMKKVKRDAKESRGGKTSEIEGRASRKWKIAFGIVLIGFIAFAALWGTGILQSPIQAPNEPCSGTIRLCFADDWSYDGDLTSHPSVAMYYAAVGTQSTWDLIRNNDLDSELLWDTYMILHPSVANETACFSIAYGVITSNDAMFDYVTNTTNLIGSCTDIPVVSVFALAWIDLEINDAAGNYLTDITINLYDTALLADPLSTVANANELWCITCNNNLVTITLGEITTVAADTYEIAATINGVAVTLDGES